VPKPLRGRIVFVGWVAVFLATAGTIALRNHAAFETRQRLLVLQDSLQAVARTHTQLAADVATLLSPALLRPLGERIGLRAPSDSETATVVITGADN
jgi:hypothetical protein